MQYTQQDIMDTAKKIIAKMRPRLRKTNIADNVAFVTDLHFDSLDEFEFMMRMEAHYKVIIKPEDFEAFHKIRTLDILCNEACKYLNTKTQINKNILQQNQK